MSGDVERVARMAEGMVQYHGRTVIAAAIRALTMENDHD